MATAERFFHCTPADVFAVLADGWSYAAWVVGAARIRSVDPDWPAPGSRLDHSVGLWPALLNDHTTVIASEPPHRLQLDAHAGPIGTAEVTIEVEPAEGGCLVRMTEDTTAGLGNLVPSPLRTAALQPRNGESLRRLALRAERRASPHRGPDPA